MSYSMEDDFAFTSPEACRMVAQYAERGRHAPVWLVLPAKHSVREVFGPSALDRRRAVSQDHAILMLCFAASVLERP